MYGDYELKQLVEAYERMQRAPASLEEGGNQANKAKKKATETPRAKSSLWMAPEGSLAHSAAAQIRSDRRKVQRGDSRSAHHAKLMRVKQSTPEADLASGYDPKDSLDSAWKTTLKSRVDSLGKPGRVWQDPDTGRRHVSGKRQVAGGKYSAQGNLKRLSKLNMPERDREELMQMYPKDESVFYAWQTLSEWTGKAKQAKKAAKRKLRAGMSPERAADPKVKERRPQPQATGFWHTHAAQDRDIEQMASGIGGRRALQKDYSKKQRHSSEKRTESERKHSSWVVNNPGAHTPDEVEAAKANLDWISKYITRPKRLGEPEEFKTRDRYPSSKR